MLNHMGRKREATPLALWKWMLEEKSVSCGLGEISKGFSCSFFLIAFLHTLVVLPAQVQLPLWCRVDGPVEQHGLHAGQRRVQPLACALLSACAVFQHTGLLLLWRLSRRYMDMSPPGQRCLAARQNARTKFFPLRRDKNAVFRMASDPVSCPDSLNPTPDHLTAATIQQKKWGVCPKVCQSQILGPGLAIEFGRSNILLLWLWTD